jgi:DNA-binding CsgD family transcriptional regulator
MGRRGLPVTLETLSPREEEVLRGYVMGLSTEEIATALGIARDTVRTHRQNLLLKSHARSFYQVVALWAASAAEDYFWKKTGFTRDEGSGDGEQSRDAATDGDTDGEAAAGAEVVQGGGP